MRTSSAKRDVTSPTCDSAWPSASSTADKGMEGPPRRSLEQAGLRRERPCLASRPGPWMRTPPRTRWNPRAAELVSSVMRRAAAAAVLSALVLCLPALASRARTEPAPDRLTAEIDRWAAFLRTNASTDEDWTQVKQGSEPVMARARSALRDGRRLLALQRLAALEGNLAASLYVQARPAAAGDRTAFEAEWKRMGGVLHDRLAAPRGDALAAGAPPSCARSARPRCHRRGSTTTRASSTGGTPCPRPASSTSGRPRRRATSSTSAAPLGLDGEEPPPVRALRAEIEALEGEVLAAYRPPAAIDSHGDFITTGRGLREALLQWPSVELPDALAMVGGERPLALYSTVTLNCRKLE